MKRPRSFSWKPQNNLTKMDSDPQSLAFDSGGTGKRSQGWGYSSYSPNSAISESDNLIVERSREAQRKNSFVHRARTSLCSSELGSELTPFPTTPFPEFNKQMLELWNEHAPDICIGEQVGVQGLFYLAIMARQSSGECFIHKINRPKSAGLALPFQLKIYESQQCPIWCNSFASNGNQIINGVELDNLGERVAYWMHKNNPLEMNLKGSSMELLRIPASEMIHFYHSDLGRCGQLRGIPNGVQSLVPLKVWSEYDDNESIKASSQAGYTAFVRRSTPSPEQLEQMVALEAAKARNGSVTDTKLHDDGTGVAAVNLEAGTVQVLADDEDMTFAPTYNSTGGDSFSYRTALRSAAGLGVSHYALTGDLSKVNDRVLRFAANEERRLIKQRLNLFTIPQLCKRVWQWSVESAVLSGAIQTENFAQNKRKYLKIDFIPEAFAYLQPVQDVNAKVIALNNGLAARDTTLREMNLVPEQVDNSRAESLQREKSLGIDAISLMNEVNAAKAKAVV